MKATHSRMRRPRTRTAPGVAAGRAAPGAGAADAPRRTGQAPYGDLLVRVEDVSKSYRVGEQVVAALSHVNLNIEKGVFMAIAGPSGSGKSTLLNLIGCIDTPTSGHIVIGNETVTGRTPDELAALRGRSIGFIFQTFNLLPVLSAAENVEYPLLQRRDIDAAERARRVRRYLDLVGLADFAHHRPNQMSGGQRQRVAIARALAVHPKIILADEPTANLDHRTGGRILRLMRRINRNTGATFVFSTHDQRVIDMAVRRVDLEDGQIVRLGVRRGKEWVYAAERFTLGEAEADAESDADDA